MTRKYTNRGKNKKHGMWHTRFYYVWDSLKGRCLNKNNKKYDSYGARGIKVCPEWMDFINFKNDMLESYNEHVEKFGEKNTLIDREDNNGNYCKENCRWATAKEQARNQRFNRLETHNGQTKCLSEWAEIFGMTPDVLRGRLNRGWDIEKALTFPPKKYKTRKDKGTPRGSGENL